MPPTPHGTTAKSGEDCPESGLWEVVGHPESAAELFRGNIMPPWCGKSVTWRLVRPK
ncbi:MAG: hypothetical protein Q8O35_14210 [Humidesulfovibrio sp.]|uniref:hypothetical protein n=1 Tax=Humidesulfovibrio sp. TaxID=2910988 RepID=UPI0027345EE2|nr:hypothetical protein [Humidesulfovibrio sp.]MDP2849323.1 hypothetical protein [Humidesulfovibrio sp.]